MYSDFVAPALPVPSEPTPHPEPRRAVVDSFRRACNGQATSREYSIRWSKQGMLEWRTRMRGRSDEVLWWASKERQAGASEPAKPYFRVSRRQLLYRKKAKRFTKEGSSYKYSTYYKFTLLVVDVGLVDYSFRYRADHQHSTAQHPRSRRALSRRLATKNCSRLHWGQHCHLVQQSGLDPESSGVYDVGNFAICYTATGIHLLDPAIPAATQPDRVGVDDPNTDYLCRRLIMLPSDSSTPPTAAE